MSRSDHIMSDERTEDAGLSGYQGSIGIDFDNHLVMGLMAHRPGVTLIRPATGGDKTAPKLGLGDN